jgi:hypothetical protein
MQVEYLSTSMNTVPHSKTHRQLVEINCMASSTHIIPPGVFEHPCIIQFLPKKFRDSIIPHVFTLNSLRIRKPTSRSHEKSENSTLGAKLSKILNSVKI